MLNGLLNSRRALVIGVTVCLAGFGGITGVSMAAYPFQRYTRSNPDCDGSGTDPVNWAIYGDAAYWQNTSKLITDEVGWGDPPGPVSSMWLGTGGGGCFGADDQRKLGFRRGHHTRLWEAPELINQNYWTVGDAHRERIVVDIGGCKPASDAVYPRIDGMTGFDAGVFEMQVGHGKHHGLALRYKGAIHRPHRAHLKQCNGDRVGWNGAQLKFILNKKAP